MFDERYEQLTNKDKELFAHTVNNLMLKSFVLRETYDRQSKIMKPNNDYSFIEKNIDLVRDYLAYSGWIVEKDTQLGVIMIQNEYYENRIRMDFITSLMIYALRYAYEIQREQNAMTEEVYFSSASLLQLMMDKSLIQPDKKPSAVSLAASYRFLENHNIIARISGEFRDRDLQFYILPSILYVIDNDRINAIFDQVQANSEGE